MRDRHETSKTLFTIGRYALAQFGFWFCLEQIQTWKQDILWIIAIPILGFVLNTGIVPYIAARAIQRKTMLGYARSRNGAFMLHIGFGLLLSLRLFEVYNVIIPCIIMLLGSLVIAGGLIRPSTKGSC